MFRDVLRDLRKSRNLTQEQLASAIDVERSSIGKYEGNKNNEPSIETLKRIASFFHVSIDYLLEYNAVHTVNVETEDEENLLSDYRSMNDEGKEVIRRQIYTMKMSGLYKKDRDISDMEA